MYQKVFLFLIGFGLTTIGLVYIISYLNLLTIGYNFLYYVKVNIRYLVYILVSIYLLIKL